MKDKDKFNKIKNKFKFIERNKIYKFILFLILLFTFAYCSMLENIEGLKQEIELKDKEIEIEENKKFQIIEKIQIQKMKELIFKCTPNYYIGFYRISKDKSFFKTVEIIGDKDYPTASIRFFNPSLFNANFIIEKEYLEEVKNNERFISIDDFSKFNKSLDLLNLSKNSFDKIKIVVIKNFQNEPIYIQSIARVGNEKNYKCNEEKMGNILQILTDNFLMYI